MLKPQKSKLAEWIFSAYSNNLFRRKFSSFRVAGLEHLIRPGAVSPLLLLSNHSSWWDGLVAFRLSRLARHNAFFLMETANLRRYPFFRRLGALPVDLESPRIARDDIASAAAKLCDPDDSLWVFPQGKIEPGNVESLNINGGTARIVSHCGLADTICVAMSYQFHAEFLPCVYIRIAPAVASQAHSAHVRRNLTNEFGHRLTDVRRRLYSDIANERLDEYRSI